MILSILAVTTAFGLPKVLQDIPPGIGLAFKSANSKDLAAFFNKTIELVILDKEDVYSRQQAEIIVGDFFRKHKPTSYKTIHKGGKEQAQYAIGNLVTNNGNFRVYYLIKWIDNKAYIHQLRIEPEDE